jgi:hypothetical protein
MTNLQAARKDGMNTTESNKEVIRKFLEEVINQNRMERADDRKRVVFPC